MIWQRTLSLLLICLLLSAIGLESGCTEQSRHDVLAEIFDGVPPVGQQSPPPRPYVRHPRRPPPYTPPPPILIKVKPYKAAFQIDWKTLLRKLPKDAVGGIDWVKAIETGVIKPKNSIDPKHPQPNPVLPLDVHLHPAGLPLFEVTYPHKAHTEWLACTNCHTRIFQMKAGADKMTMKEIFNGKFCGECHGKVSFDPTTACPRCHRKLAGPS